MTNYADLMRAGTYVGQDAALTILHGKRALLLIDGDSVTAQFDDVTTGYGYGWHPFKLSDFDLEPEE